MESIASAIRRPSRARRPPSLQGRPPPALPGSSAVRARSPAKLGSPFLRVPDHVLPSSSAVRTAKLFLRVRESSVVPTRFVRRPRHKFARALLVSVTYIWVWSLSSAVPVRVVRRPRQGHPRRPRQSRRAPSLALSCFGEWQSRPRPSSVVPARVGPARVVRRPRQGRPPSSSCRPCQGRLLSSFCKCQLECRARQGRHSVVWQFVVSSAGPARVTRRPRQGRRPPSAKTLSAVERCSGRPPSPSGSPTKLVW